MILASMSCQEMATTPAPTTCQVSAPRASASAPRGLRTARSGAMANSATGNRSSTNPRLTTMAFLRGRRSTIPAVKSCGRNHPACAIAAITPTARGSGVSLLMKRARIVPAEMKVEPNQKLAPSKRLVQKFQGYRRSTSAATSASLSAGKARSSSNNRRNSRIGFSMALRFGKWWDDCDNRRPASDCRRSPCPCFSIACELVKLRQAKETFTCSASWYNGNRHQGWRRTWLNAATWLDADKRR